MGLISFVWNLLTLPLTIAIYIFKTILFLPLNIAIFCFKTLVLRPVEISYRLFVTYPRFLYKVLYVGPRVVIDLVHSLEVRTTYSYYTFKNGIRYAVMEPANFINHSTYGPTYSVSPLSQSL